MTLTILLTAGYYVDGASDPGKALLLVAVGCNLAWGLIDGLLYVMSDLYERTSRRAALASLRSADPGRAAAAVHERVDQALGTTLQPHETDVVASALLRAAQEAPDPPTGVTFDNVRSAAAAVAMNMVALVPPVIVFAVVDDWQTALNIARWLLVLMMFVVGEAWGRSAGLRPWRAGLSMVAFGTVMVAIAVVLGG